MLLAFSFNRSQTRVFTSIKTRPRRPFFRYLCRFLLTAGIWTFFFYRFLLSQSFAFSDPEINKALAIISPERMQRDVTTLSSPAFGGRQAGTEGDYRSALFVTKRFSSLGLEPGGTERLGAETALWAQRGPVSITLFHDSPTLEFSHSGVSINDFLIPARFGDDFLPILDSPSVHSTSPLVFVGHGISDPAHGLDEYEGLDVRNRIVLFLRGKPRSYPTWVPHRDKEHIARQKGAVGFLTVTGPLLSPYESRRGIGQAPLALYTNNHQVLPLPGAWISTTLGERLFETGGQSLREIQQRLEDGKNIQSNELSVVVDMQWNSNRRTSNLINVLGLIPGQDPELQDETVIIGAHRDHFGRQGELLFAGADDNASGTAVLIELARALTELRDRLRRTILLVSFSGEEQDLQGSSLYVAHPTRSLSQTVAMINLDHVGNGNGKLTVGITKLGKSVVGRASEFAGLIGTIKVYGFFPGGDHVPFVQVGVPTVTIAGSGPHPDFHRATDTSENVQPALLKVTAQYVLALTWMLANEL